MIILRLRLGKYEINSDGIPWKVNDFRVYRRYPSMNHNIIKTEDDRFNDNIAISPTIHNIIILNFSTKLVQHR